MESRSRVFRRGRHIIRIARNGRYFDALEMTLDVRPDQTYSYITKYYNDILLVPVPLSLGALRRDLLSSEWLSAG